MRYPLVLFLVALPVVWGREVKVLDYSDNKLLPSHEENVRQAKLFGGIIYRTTTRIYTTVTSTSSYVSICATMAYACKKKKKRSLQKMQVEESNEMAPILKQFDDKVARVLLDSAVKYGINLNDVEGAEFRPTQDKESIRETRDVEDENEEDLNVRVIRDNNQAAAGSQRVAKFYNYITVQGTATHTVTTTTTTTLGTVGITGKAGECAGTSIDQYFPICG